MESWCLAMQVKFKVHIRSENEHMSGSPKVKHPQWITFIHMLAFIDSDFIGRNLCHSHKQNTHEPDIRIICFNENQSPGSDLGNVSLGFIGAGRVKPFG